LIALPLAATLLKLPSGDLWWLGALVAGALLGGLLPTLKALRLNQAMLLREG
jgi:putative ABC transport system permease protein